MIDMKRLLTVGLLGASLALAGCGDDEETDDGGGETDTGMTDTGMGDTGGEDTGGEDTGGEDTGGEDTGGEDTGGEDTGGEDTGGEDTGADVGADAADAAMPMGDLCINDADLALLLEVDATGEAQDCGLGCLGDADPGACSATCVAEATGLSADCAGCYADTVVCSIENCLAQCATDPSSEACTTCQAENCLDDFYFCTGDVEANLPVVDACINDADLVILGGDTNVTGEAQDCGLACLGDADPGACSATCVEDATGLTTDCAGCYAGTVVCSIENCLAQCATDPTSEACATCQAENCLDEFYTCTGDVEGALTSICDTYCDLAMATCTGENALYESMGDCQTACADFADTGADGDLSGDTVQCRIAHLGLAADDAATHCPHGGPDGGGVCVDGE